MTELDKKERIVIYGDSDFAEQVYYQLMSDGRYEVLAFTVDEERLKEKSFKGIDVIAFQELEKYFDKTEIKIFVAIGYSKMNTIREEVFNEVLNCGYDLLTYISKHAFIGYDVKIGAGCFICEFVSIKPGTSIQNGSIIFPNTSIGHGVTIDQFSYLSIGVCVGGYSVIEKNCFVGMHSTIRDSATISEYNLIGSASNVVKSTDSKGMYLGNPAKRIKDIDINNIAI